MGVRIVCTKVGVVEVVTSGHQCDSQKQRGVGIVSKIEIWWSGGECTNTTLDCSSEVVSTTFC